MPISNGNLLKFHLKEQETTMQRLRVMIRIPIIKRKRTRDGEVFKGCGITINFSQTDNNLLSLALHRCSPKEKKSRDMVMTHQMIG